MRIIKVLIAASEELRPEVLEFTSLIEHLNKVLRSRGIELKRVKWKSNKPHVDFQVALKDCQFCLNLFWKALDEHSDEELSIAYENLKNGQNPKNIYVFFKEPACDISNELKDFKANFVTNYGHFFCKFENVDTMNLHFILQFEYLQNQMETDLIKIKDGKVVIGDETFADLDNVPFAVLNKEYQRLKEELKGLDEQQAQLKKKFSENATDSDVLNELVAVSTKRNNVAEEFEKHLRYLFNIALSFAKKSEDMYSERLTKARDLFEKGEVSEADRILNMDVLKREAENEISTYEQSKKNLIVKTEEFRTKAATVLANREIVASERFETAREAYDEAINITQLINIEKDNLYNLYCEIGHFYIRFGVYKSAFSYYSKGLQTIANCPQSLVTKEQIADLEITLSNIISGEFDPYSEDEYLTAQKKEMSHDALQLAQDLYQLDNEEHKFLLARALEAYGCAFYDQNDAKRKFEESLQLFEELYNIDTKNYASYYANALRNNEEYQKALNIFSMLAVEDRSYLEAKADTMKDIALSLSANNAEKTLRESLSIYEAIFTENPYRLCPKILEVSKHLANIYLMKSIGDKEYYHNFMNSCNNAIVMCNKLAEISPSSFTPAYIDMITEIVNYLSFYNKGDKNIEIQNLKKLLSILLKLYESQPDIVCEEIANIYQRLAFSYHLVRQQKNELDSYKEGLEYYKECTKKDPCRYMLGHAICLENYGMALKHYDLINSSIACLREALSLFEKCLLISKIKDVADTEVENMITEDICRVSSEIKSITDEMH